MMWVRHQGHWKCYHPGEAPVDSERVMMVYREPMSGIPKLALDREIRIFEDAVEECGATVEDRTMIMEHGDTRQEAIQWSE